MSKNTLFTEHLRWLLLCMIKTVKITGFGGKKYQTLLWQLKFKEWKGTRTWSFSYENYIIRNLKFGFLKRWLHFYYYYYYFVFFTSSMRNFHITHSFLKYPFLRKMQTRFCRGRIAKNRLIPNFSPFLFFLQSWCILSKIDSEKKLSFPWQKIYVVFLKQ